MAAYDLERETRRLTEELALKKAENEQQAELDKVAMAAYAQYGKPTGLTFTEWEQVQINAWKADSKTNLSFADWLSTNLSQGHDNKPATESK